MEEVEKFWEWAWEKFEKFQSCKKKWSVPLFIYNGKKKYNY